MGAPRRRAAGSQARSAAGAARAGAADRLVFRVRLRSGRGVRGFGTVRRADDASARGRSRFGECGDPGRGRRRPGNLAVHGHRHAAGGDRLARRSLRAGSARERDRAAQRVRLRRAVRVAEPARALSRAAQSVRRRDRGIHGSCGSGHLAAGAAGRRRDGGGASPERVRSDQYAKRLGRQLHRRFRRGHHAHHAAVSSCGRDAGGDRSGRVRPRSVRRGRPTRLLPGGSGDRAAGRHVVRRNLRAARSRSRRRVRARWQPPGSFTVSCKRGRGCAPFGFRLLQPRATAPESRTPRRCW